MEKVLKVLQITNQVVWILVGLATLYSIYWFITQNPLQQAINSLNPLSQMEQPSGQSQLQDLLQKYGR